MDKSPPDEIPETDHDEWRNNPIDHNAKQHLYPQFLRPKYMVEHFVADLAENWIHHNQQPDR